uniref:Nep1-like protein n=2 Tax=Hyaloperonospora arabidopsidis TaxID=272952 RepID=M4BJP9_HYAAE|nr:Nep1-like protein [Hyaloperonospora arabidopsidis]
MRTGAFLYPALLAVLVPVSSPDGCGTERIPHHEVKAFAQPEPVTISEKAAVRLNPTLLVTYGCQPYPAVNEFGQTSGGLKPTGDHNGHCKGSGHGSQVYARSAWFGDKWAIMFAYYFPKSQPRRSVSVRHSWEFAVVWIANPEAPEKTLALTTRSFAYGYFKYTSFDASEMDGERVKLRYWQHADSDLYLELTSLDGGVTRPLIMWEQLPEKARCALNEATWNGGFKCPLSDEAFEPLLNASWPF